jgi:hypothetical protein
MGNHAAAPLRHAVDFAFFNIRVTRKGNIADYIA